jgi:hypothetical protein
MFRKIFFALLPSICVVPFLALSSCGNTIEKIVLQGGNFSDIRQDVNFDKSIKISVVSSYTVKNKIHYSINQNSDIECLNIYDNDDGTGTLVVRRSPVLTKTVIATLYAYDYSSNQFIKRSINILPNNYGY